MGKNVETVKRAFEAFNRRDIDEILAMCDAATEAAGIGDPPEN